jgi:hypothetical protein
MSGYGYRAHGGDYYYGQPSVEYRYYGGYGYGGYGGYGNYGYSPYGYYNRPYWRNPYYPYRPYYPGHRPRPPVVVRPPHDGGHHDGDHHDGNGKPPWRDLNNINRRERVDGRPPPRMVPTRPGTRPQVAPQVRPNPTTAPPRSAPPRSDRGGSRLERSIRQASQPARESRRVNSRRESGTISPP